jgi:hypothetical protein
MQVQHTLEQLNAAAVHIVFMTHMSTTFREEACDSF